MRCCASKSRARRHAVVPIRSTDASLSGVAARQASAPSETRSHTLGHPSAPAGAPRRPGAAFSDAGPASTGILTRPTEHFFCGPGSQGAKSVACPVPPIRGFRVSWRACLILWGPGVIFRAPRSPGPPAPRKWCGSQAVRQWFAKPSYVGSNPIRTSQRPDRGPVRSRANVGEPQALPRM